MKPTRHFSRYLKSKDLRGQILERIGLSAKGYTTAKEIGKTLKKSTYEMSSHLKALEKQGKVYKIFPETGSCFWHLMKNFRCYNCGTTKNPSDREFKTCVNCERSEIDFQAKWLSRPIVSNSVDMPVWIYG